MSYRIFWEIPETVLCLALGEDVSTEEFVEINDQINSFMDARTATRSVILKIDALNTERIPQSLSTMKNSQSYANRKDLKSILVIGPNKYVRLVMMLTFNLSRPTLHFAMNHEHANRFVESVITEH